MPDEQPIQPPNSPDDMPWDFQSNDPNWLYRVTSTLDNYSVVDIHWETDWGMTNKTGETHGEFEVMVETNHRKRFSCKHQSLHNALWYVTTLADMAESAAYQKQEAERAAALAKLTPEERRLLRLAS